MALVPVFDVLRLLASDEPEVDLQPEPFQDHPGREEVAAIETLG